jgi:GR25 family glycosyltransferase involved in LPS biosynthesis
MPNVFVVSLSGDTFAEVAKKYKSAGGKFAVFHVPGVLATQQDRDEHCSKTCRLFCTNSLVGCFLAHREVWKRIAQSNDVGFVYEDDVEFVALDEDAVLEALRTRDFVAHGYMDNMKNNPFLQCVAFLVTGKWHDSKSKNFDITMLWGAHAYAITAQTAHKFLQLSKGKDIHTQVDPQISEWIQNKEIKATALRPVQVIQNQFERSTQSNSTTTRKIADGQVPLSYLLGFAKLRLGNFILRSSHVIAFFFIAILAVACLPVFAFLVCLAVLWTRKKESKQKNAT